jgi:predicted transcriptional regulator
VEVGGGEIDACGIYAFAPRSGIANGNLLAIIETGADMAHSNTKGMVVVEYEQICIQVQIWFLDAVGSCIPGTSDR